MTTAGLMFDSAPFGETQKTPDDATDGQTQRSLIFTRNGKPAAEGRGGRGGDAILEQPGNMELFLRIPGLSVVAVTTGLIRRRQERPRCRHPPQDDMKRTWGGPEVFPFSVSMGLCEDLRPTPARLGAPRRPYRMSQTRRSRLRPAGDRINEPGPTGGAGATT